MDFALRMGGAMIGTALLPNLSLPMGTNTLAAIAKFIPNDTPQGLQTLNQFVGQQGALFRTNTCTITERLIGTRFVRYEPYYLRLQREYPGGVAPECVRGSDYPNHPAWPEHIAS